MQGSMDRVPKHVTTSTQRAKVVYQPAPGKPYKEPTITVNGQRLKVDNTIWDSEAFCPEWCILMMRLLPSVAFGTLRGNVLEPGMESDLTLN